MNPDLQKLQSYPFQKLARLFGEVTANAAFKPISLHIGEPKHETPRFIKDALVGGLDGLANYPTTLGSDALRGAISQWLAQRYGIPAPDAKTQVLPVNGSREALFAFAQAVIDRSKPDPVVISPNPFYQIYEGAAFLAGDTAFLQHLAGKRLRDGLRATLRRCLAAHATHLRLLAGQPEWPCDAIERMEDPVRTE